jgi:hypothetical protein
LREIKLNGKFAELLPFRFSATIWECTSLLLWRDKNAGDICRYHRIHFWMLNYRSFAFSVTAFTILQVAHAVFITLLSSRLLLHRRTDCYLYGGPIFQSNSVVSLFFTALSLLYVINNSPGQIQPHTLFSRRSFLSFTRMNLLAFFFPIEKLCVAIKKLFLLLLDQR